MTPGFGVVGCERRPSHLLNLSHFTHLALKGGKVTNIYVYINMLLFPMCSQRIFATEVQRNILSMYADKEQREIMIQICSEHLLLTF